MGQTGVGGDSGNRASDATASRGVVSFSSTCLLTVLFD
jgi:hypothetical protein